MGDASGDYPSLSAMHRTVAQRGGSRTAMRYRRGGDYVDLSWRDYRTQADHAAAGLIELGVEAGDRVGILSRNRCEWLIADHAMLSAGAITVPMHAPLAAKQVAYQLSHSEAVGVIVSGPDQADKVFAVLDELPLLRFIIVFDSIDAKDDRVRVLDWRGLMRNGEQGGAALQHHVLARESAITRDDLATIIYTSGTTGNPKGVMLSHGNLLSNSYAVAQVNDARADDVLMSWLPYSHIYARTVDHYVTTMNESLICLAESIDTLLDDLKAVQPTWITAVPRFYEKVWASVEHLEGDERAAELRRIFGANMRFVSSGGAPLPRHVGQGLVDSGLIVLEGYGLTESSPAISFNRFDNFRIGTVGPAIPGVEVAIAEDGEILTRGPHVMKGYWKNPDATAEVIDADGWLHTGDVGALDEDGFLTITDRKKDLIITSGGKNIAPSELERLLISDEFIDQAVVYGDGRPFVVAMIVPNFANLEAKLAEWREDLAVRDEFVTSERVIDFFARRIVAVMQEVSNPERIKKFLVLGRAFSVDRDELTATLKVRRRHIVRQYEAQLAALYSGDGGGVIDYAADHSTVQ